MHFSMAEIAKIRGNLRLPKNRFSTAYYGTPEIFNTDQGSQFASECFTGVLIKNGITVSTAWMDADGFWTIYYNLDNRALWAGVKKLCVKVCSKVSSS